MADKKPGTANRKTRRRWEKMYVLRKEGRYCWDGPGALSERERDELCIDWNLWVYKEHVILMLLTAGELKAVEAYRNHENKKKILAHIKKHGVEK